MEEKSAISPGFFEQSMLHADFGGVVPEIAPGPQRGWIFVGRALGTLDEIIGNERNLRHAGPGLIGGVLSGVMCAKGLSLGSGNKLSASTTLPHALTPRLTDGVTYPYLMLLVSGGHCQFLLVTAADKYERLGGTIDDAPGEAFDKTARLLGLAQPGGPSVEKAALSGDAKRFSFPRPLLDRSGCDMSFSGLKTALLRTRNELVDSQGGLYEQDRADFCASFQAAISDVLAEKSRRALFEYMSLSPEVASFCVAGGVAANQTIRQRLEQVATEAGAEFIAPPLRLCTDNAAMIAFAGAELYALGARDDLSCHTATLAA